jgi:hypothetical protein
MSSYDQNVSSKSTLVEAITNIIDQKLKVLECKILAGLERLSGRIEALENLGIRKADQEFIKAQNVVAKVGSRKLYSEIVDHLRSWGDKKKFKLRDLIQELESKLENFSRLADSTKIDIARNYLRLLRSTGEASFSRSEKIWQLTRKKDIIISPQPSTPIEIIEPRIVLVKNKSFAVYKEVIDYILRWAEQKKKFTLKELIRELESSVAGWGALEETTLRSYISAHLHYLKNNNQACKINGERAWIATRDPSSLQKILREVTTKRIVSKPRRKVLGYIRRNPIHQDVLIKIIYNLKDVQNFSSRDVREIIDKERAESSDETRRCLTYAYLKYLENNRIATRTLAGYKIVNTELLEDYRGNELQELQVPSLFEDL